MYMSSFFAFALMGVILRPAAPAIADDAVKHETMTSDSLAILLNNGLFIKSLDSTSVNAWKELITTLNNKKETLHAKRVAWICLIHPLAAGRRLGATALINMYDLSDPQEVSVLLGLDNDCLRTIFVDLAEDGYLIKYNIAPQIAELLEDEKHLRNNRQVRLVNILRALYHYTDTSVVSNVAKYLGDPDKRVRVVSARTLGKITGHTFSRTGDMDFTPAAYYITKAKIWWLINKDRPEYQPAEKHPIQRYRPPELKKQTPEDFLRLQVTHLQDMDFIVWAEAFNGLLEFGVEHEPSLFKPLLESASVNPVDAVYTEILMRFIEFYSKKRKTVSEYQYNKYYDIKELCH